MTRLDSAASKPHVNADMTVTTDTEIPVFASRRDYWRAYRQMVFADHGIFRLAYRNFFPVAPGVYRSNQPAPHQIQRAADFGIRTIVNLRGGGTKGYHLLEKDSCTAAGLRLIHFNIRSRDLPPVRALHHARILFETAEYPLLMHCKSGADRVGFMSGLYLLIAQNRPPEEAQRQLHWKFGHYRQSRTGVLDHFFEVFAEHRARTGDDFFTWVDNAYDPEAIKASFHASRWATVLVDRVLRRE